VYESLSNIFHDLDVENESFNGGTFS